MGGLLTAGAAGAVAPPVHALQSNETDAWREQAKLRNGKPFEVWRRNGVGDQRRKLILSPISICDLDSKQSNVLLL